MNNFCAQLATSKHAAAMRAIAIAGLSAAGVFSPFSACAQTSAAVPVAATPGAQAEPSLRITVQAKDNLSKFASKLLVSPKAWGEVAKLNQLKDVNRIFPGQVLDVPLRLLKFQPEGARVLSASGEVSLASGANLQEGQQIKVGPNSSAVLELADKSKVKVLPGSLAELVKNRNYNGRDASASIASTWYSGVIRLVQGEVEVLASKVGRAEPLKVQLPTAVIGVRGTVFRAGVAGNNGKTEVIEGSVQADNPAQRSGARVAAGFGALIDPTQRDVKPVQLLAAPAMAGATELRKPSVSFGFSAVTGAASYRLQVAKDAAFNDLVLDTRSNRPQADLSTLANGAWFVRARGIDQLGLEGLDGSTRITVLEPLPPPPAPVALPPAPPPAPNPFDVPRVSQSSLRLENGNALLELRQFDERLTRMGMRVADDAAFTKNVKTFAVTHTINLGKLPQGDHFVQFVCTIACDHLPSSVIYKMSLDGNWGQTVQFMQSPLALSSQ